MKDFLRLALLGIVIMSTDGLAQTSGQPLKFGLRSGINLGTTTEKVPSGYKKEPQIGLTAGGLLEYWFKSNAAIQVNAIYNMKGVVWKPKIGSGEASMRTNYLSIPILYKYARNKVYVAGGPEIGFLLSGKVSNGTDEDIKDQMKQTEIGLYLCIGSDYPLGQMMSFLDAGVSVGVSQINKEGESAKNIVLFINVGLKSP